MEWLLIEICAILKGIKACVIDKSSQEARPEDTAGMNRNGKVDIHSLFDRDNMAPFNMVDNPPRTFECGNMLIPCRTGDFRHNLYRRYQLQG